VRRLANELLDQQVGLLVGVVLDFLFNILGSKWCISPLRGFDLVHPLRGFDLVHPLRGFDLVHPLRGFDLVHPLRGFDLVHQMHQDKQTSTHLEADLVKAGRVLQCRVLLVRAEGIF
jgi:hypothetical protein